MMRDIGDAIGNAFAMMFYLCCVFVPLGMWKLIEIIVWVFRHVHFGVN